MQNSWPVLLKIDKISTEKRESLSSSHRQEGPKDTGGVQSDGAYPKQDLGLKKDIR